VKTVKIEICRGTSCHLLGSGELVEAVESLPAGQRDKIDMCTLDCLKSCKQGPNVRIDGIIFSGVTPEHLLAMLEEKLCQPVN